MYKTLITTPAGNTAELYCDYSTNSTCVRLRMGSLTVTRQSKNANDVQQIAQAIQTLDDLMTNLQSYKPFQMKDDQANEMLMVPMMIDD